MQPGELNRRLALQAPNDTDNGAGGVTRAYATVTSLWAQVMPQAMSGDIAADSLGGLLRYRILIRHREDVTTRHRFVDGDTVYRVIAARPSADRRFLEIDADVRED